MTKLVEKAEITIVRIHGYRSQLLIEINIINAKSDSAPHALIIRAVLGFILSRNS